jgi:FemAB-related protein (PEP-CTERM system-associated)
MQISELGLAGWDAWDAFVRRSPSGLPQHLAGWQTVLTHAYGYETHYLSAQNTQGELAGVLPLFVVRSPLLGTTLTTLPGGLCAQDDVAANALLGEARSLAKRLRAKRLVLHDTRCAWPGELHTSCDHEDWLVDLRGGADGVASALDRNIRRQVRMAERNGLTAVVDRSGAYLDDFYAVMSRFTHQAGTPIFGRNFLAEVIAAFPNGFNLVLIYQGTQPIGGYFQLELGDTNYGTWGATLHDFLELRPVYLAYWTILMDSVDRGFAWLDMGRSPVGSNASKYKSQWATTSRPVYQQTWSPGKQVVASVAHEAQSDERFQMVRRFWPKLPLPVAQFLGPMVRRHIPFA